MTYCLIASLPHSFIVLILAAILFSLGLAVVITKRNVIAMLMGIELMLNAVNINLVAFGRFDPQLNGQFLALFVMVVAAAETAVALAIILRIYQYYQNIDPVNISELKN